MKVALLTEAGKFAVVEEGASQPGPGQVKIKVAAAGICGTDLEVFSGKVPRGWQVTYPFRLGHELAGVVEEVGPEVSGVQVGDRVVPDGRLTCGSCTPCRKGNFSACHNAGYISGGFREYSIYPARNLVKIPTGVSLEEAAVTEPLSCCVNGLSKLELPLAGTAVVMGDGPIGLLHLQLLKSKGLRTAIVGMMADRLQLAGELGADEAINFLEQDPVQAVNAFTAGCGADIVVVAVGSARVLEQSLEMAARRGQILYFAASMQARVDLPLDLVHYKELRLLGSYDSTIANFETALQMLACGMVRVKPLLTHRFELEHIQEAFATAKERKGLKILVTPVGAQAGKER